MHQRLGHYLQTESPLLPSLPGSDRHPLYKQLPRPQQPVANGSTKTKQTVPIPSSSVGARRAPNATANKIPTPALKIPPRSVNSKAPSHPQESSRKAVAPSGASKSKVAAGAKPPKPALVPDSELLPIADYLEKHSFLFDTTTPNVPAAAPTPTRVSTLSNPEETDNTTSELVPPVTSSNSIESNVSKRVTVLPENVDSTTGPLLETLTTPKVSRKSSASSPKIAPSFPQCAGCTKPIRPSKDEDETAVSQTPSQPHTPKTQTLSVQCVVCARQYHAKCFLQNAGGSQLDKLANGSLNLPSSSKKLSTAENSNISPIPPVLADVTTAAGHPTPIEWLAAAASTKVCQVCLSGKIDLTTVLQEDSTAPCLSKILTNAASATRVEHYVAQLLVNGFACVPLRSDQKDDNEQSDNTNDEEDGSLIKELTALRTKTDLLYKTLQKCYDIQRDVRPGQTPSLEVGYSNFRERGEGRFELVEPFFLDTLLPLITARGENGSPILEVLRKVLNRDPESQDNEGEAIEPIEDTVEGSVLIKKLRKVDLKPMSSGCFYSLSGSANQNWHTDGPSLSGGGDTDTLLPYAINIFVPLVPLSNQNGTDFQPGSHLAPHTLEGLKKALKAVEGTNFDEGQWDKWYSGKVAPPVGLGEALLFDYRVEHRGLGNRGFADRPCVYITYAQPWYVDTYNFGTKRYAQKLELPADWQVGRSERAARRERLSQQIQSQVE